METRLQMLPLEVAVILQFCCESTVTYCEPTVNFLNLQLIPNQILHGCQWIYINLLQCMILNIKPHCSSTVICLMYVHNLSLRVLDVEGSSTTEVLQYEHSSIT